MIDTPVLSSVKARKVSTTINNQSTNVLTEDECGRIILHRPFMLWVALAVQSSRSSDAVKHD